MGLNINRLFKPLNTLWIYYWANWPLNKQTKDTMWERKCMVYESFCLKILLNLKEDTHKSCSFIYIHDLQIILSSHFCVTNCPKFGILDNKYPFSHFLHVKNLNGFILGSLMNLQSRCWAGLHHLKTWLGLEDPPSSLLAWSLAEILVPSQGSMAPAFSRGRERGRQREVGGRKTKTALKGSCSVFL